MLALIEPISECLAALAAHELGRRGFSLHCPLVSSRPVGAKIVDRRLAAILVADVVGYSRLMEADEIGTLAALRRRRAAILEPTVRAHGGRIVKVMGDG